MFFSFEIYMLEYSDCLAVVLYLYLNAPLVTPLIRSFLLSLIAFEELLILDPQTTESSLYTQKLHSWLLGWTL
jgi:hypothetical protein